MSPVIISDESEWAASGPPMCAYSCICPVKKTLGGFCHAQCTPTGGVAMVVAVAVAIRDDGSFGAWLPTIRPWRVVILGRGSL